MKKKNLKLPKLNISEKISQLSNRQGILSRIRFDIITKGLFVFIFSISCLLILLPQVDYQSWYPKKLRTFDFELSLDFREHKKAEIDISNSELNKDQQQEYISTIYKRAADAEIRDFYLEKNSQKIDVHLSSTYSDSYIKTLLAQGDITIKKPLDGLNFEENLGQMFDESSYTETSIDQNRIQDAILISENENYSFIEIVTDSEQTEIWNSTVENSEQKNVATIINGELNLSWIASTVETQRDYPVLLLMSGKPDLELILEQLKSKPLDFEIPAPEIKTVPSIYPDESLYILSASILLSFVASLLYRIIIKKQTTKQITLVGIMVIGLLTLIKLQSISLGLIQLLIIGIIIASLSLISIKHELILATLFAIAGLVFGQASNPILSESSHLLLISGAYTFVFFIICFFFDLYEEE